MAKKTGISATNGNESVFDIVNSFDATSELLSEAKTAVIKEWISSGNYILNACLSGSLFRAIGGNKILTLAGASSTGKTFIALSFAREAQKLGYTIILLDSEGASDKAFVERLGCDSSKFIIKQVNTVLETSSFVANLCDKLNEKKESDRPKIMIILDSISNLTSDKELNDTLDNVSKLDMTRNKELKAFFRINASRLSKLGIPMICTAHVYQTLDLYSRQQVSSGTGCIYASSQILKLSAGKLDDKESDKIMESKTGDFIKTGVVVTAVPEKSRYSIPQKIQIQIPFFKAPNPYIGLEKYLSWEHDGIMEGILVPDKDYEKMTPMEKSQCHDFKFNGEILHAFPKIAGVQKNRRIVVRHLGEELPLGDLWTPKVLTEELLHKLDDDIIRPLFELPSQDSFKDVDELVDGNMVNIKTGEVL